VEFKIIKDKAKAKHIYIQASLTSDENHANYSEEQFEKAWSAWIGFYVLYNKLDPIAFCGIRIFDDQYSRIFDRYFVFPKYRNNSLAHQKWSSNMIELLVDECIDKGYQPFFSIQTQKKRRAAEVAVKTFNKYIKHQFKVLDYVYCTVPTNKEDPNCWQNIATIAPYKISLEKKDE